jgi:hypothetical protein
LTSDHKIKANRVNAQASTGPKNADDKTSRVKSPKRRPICAACEYARYKLLSDALADPHYGSWREKQREKMAVLRSLLRKNAPDLPVELVAFLNSTPQGPHKFATILSQEAKQLLAMDRYERRALSQRKSAIRAFDETCRRPTDCNNWNTHLIDV